MFITVCTKQNTSSLGDSIELFLHLEDSLLSDFNFSQRQMLKNLRNCFFINRDKCFDNLIIISCD